MIKKICFLNLAILLFLAFQNANADVSWRDWSGDHLWNNKYNWTKTAINTDSGLVYESMVPTLESGAVNITAGSVTAPNAYPVVNSALPEIYRLTVGGNGMGEACLTFESGASLSIQYILRLGNYSTSPSDVHGKLIMNDGSLVVGSDGYIDVGSIETDGTIVLNNGYIYTPKINIPGGRNSQAKVYINGGTLSVGVNGLGIVNDISTGRSSQIDIAGGELVIEGDVVNSVELLFAKGVIFGYSGNSTILCDYGQTHAGKTTVVAVDYNPVLARLPMPSDQKNEVTVNGALSWKAGDSAQSHDVYIGTDRNEVLNANRYQPDLNGNGFVDVSDVLMFLADWLEESDSMSADLNSDGIADVEDFAIIAQSYGNKVSTAYKGRVDTNNYSYEKLSYETTYYWRVDEVRNGVVNKGNVWAFRTKKYVDDQKPGWTLAFSDEFNGDKPDWSVWDSESGYPGHILSSRWPENVAVEDGCLRLLTKKGGVVQQNGRQGMFGLDHLSKSMVIGKRAIELLPHRGSIMLFG